MKTILVLTDFSENAESAAETAFLLAGKMHANLFLYNSYIKYPTMAAYAGGLWLVDEFIEREERSKNMLQLLTESLESLSGRLGTGDRLPSISSMSEDNDLGSAISAVTNEKNVELIVMGARSGKNEDGFPFGNDTHTVVEHSNKPILIIPAGANLENINKIVFATDYEEADIKALHYLTKLGQLLHYELEIIHVKDSGNASSLADEREALFIEKIAEISYPGMGYKKVSGKTVVHRLNNLLTQTQGGLLAMVHVHNSYLVRLFQHSIVKEAIASQKTPLLVFPSTME